MQHILKIIPTEISLTMADGVSLAGQLWESPASPSPSILVLCRTCQPFLRLEHFAQSLVELGYSVFLQSVRGCGASGGHFLPYTQEWQDGAATVSALLNGTLLGRQRRFLFTGLGYDGQSALTAAIAAPVEMVAGIAVAGVTDSHFHSGLCQNGLWSGEELLRLTRFLPEALRPSRASFAEWLANPRWATGLSPFSSQDELESWLLAARKEQVFDSFWRQQALCPKLYLRELPDVPTLVATGSSASTCSGALELAHRLAERNFNSVEIHLGDEDDAALESCTPESPIVQTMLKWFAEFPCKRGRPAPDDDTVHCLLHSLDDTPSAWHRWHAWPAMELSLCDLYLDAGRLTRKTPTAASRQEFQDNPYSPSPSSEDNWGFAPSAPRFGPFALPLAIRADTLAYTSEPYPESFTLLGQPQLRLRVATTRGDTQFLARLVALAPDHRELTITYGASRLALRYGTENLVAFSPNADSSTTIAFSLRPVAWRFPKGTRLRLEISSNDFPRYALGTNMLPRQGGVEHSPRNARNSIEIDARGTSRLTLPVLNKDPPGKSDQARTNYLPNSKSRRCS